jgi:hypothetical protein
MPAAVGLLLTLATTTALAQKQGGTLRVQHRDGPASMSILEEGTVSAIMPMMGVFNNFVLFDQHVPPNRVESIVPDLAIIYFMRQATCLQPEVKGLTRWITTSSSAGAWRMCGSTADNPQSSPKCLRSQCRVSSGASSGT